MADILIRMDMPTGCAECDLNNDTICVLIKGCIYDESNGSNRRPDCPLHELPEHGDLIDRDAVIDGEADIISSDGYYAEFGFSRDMLRCMPVIIPSSKEDA